MHDDFESAVWADHHAALGQSLKRLFRSIDVGMRRLNRIEFAAPWLEQRRQRTRYQ